MHKHAISNDDDIYADFPLSEDLPEQPTKPKVQTKTKIIIGAVIGVVMLVAILAIAFVAKAGQYDERYLPNTYIQQTDVSGMTRNEAYEALSQNVNDLQVRIVDEDRQNGTEDDVLKAPDVDLRLDQGALDDILKRQNKWEWLSALFGSPHRESIGVLYDADAVNEFVNNLDCVSGKSRKDPINATVEYDAEQGKFTASGAEQGNRADADEIVNMISAALSEGGGEIHVSDTYTEPKWTTESPEIIEAVDKLNTYTDKQISYNIDMIPNAEKLTRDQIASFLKVDSSNPEKLSVECNDEAIIAWLREIGKKYDTSGKERTFTTPLGKQVSVAGGTYGWITDEEAMLPIIKENLLVDDAVINQDFKYQQEADHPKGDGLDEVGNTYIDIDKTEQMVRYVDNGKVTFEARTVTGTNTPKRDTPVGVWTVLEKAHDYTMTGEIVPSTGKPEYVTKTCTWLRFTWSGCGMHCSDHGARTDWRVNAWLTNGSHGCANMHHGDVNVLYDMTAIGTPVIVHM